jgi:hypothetical protein
MHRNRFGEDRVLTVVHPSHTSNILKEPELVFFRGMMKLKASAEGEFDDDSVDNQGAKLVQAYEEISTSMDIWRSDSALFRLQFSEGSLRRNPGS